MRDKIGYALFEAHKLFFAALVEAGLEKPYPIRNGEVYFFLYVDEDESIENCLRRLNGGDSEDDDEKASGSQTESDDDAAESQSVDDNYDRDEDYRPAKRSSC
jgi:hypothetical protein